MNININFDSISSAIGSIITLTFALYYFTSYLIVKKERLHLIMALAMLSFFVYLSGYSIYSSSTHPDVVLFWTRICYAGGASIAYTTFLLSSEINNQHSKILNKIILLEIIILIVTIFLPLDLLFTNVLNPYKTHSSVIKGPLFSSLLAILLFTDLALILRFIYGLFQNKENRYLLTPLLIGLIFWFFEAIFDAVFGAVLGLVNMKFSLGPIFMTFSIAIYSGRFAEKRNSELIQIKKENKQIYNNLIYDKLSTLYSRQYFLEILEQRIQLANREEISDCIMFFDVDNFKSVNDELGHNYGDNLISYVGETLRNHSRKSDTCARYGGDEFLILLENCSLKDARKIAEAIQNKFTSGLIEILDQWKKSKEVTFSIGIVSSNSWTKSSESTIRKADIAMYKSKHSGKNTISNYSEDMENLANN